MFSTSAGPGQLFTQHHQHRYSCTEMTWQASLSRSWLQILPHSHNRASILITSSHDTLTRLLSCYSLSFHLLHPNGITLGHNFHTLSLNFPHLIQSPLSSYTFFLPTPFPVHFSFSYIHSLHNAPSHLLHSFKSTISTHLSYCVVNIFREN